MAILRRFVVIIAIAYVHYQAEGNKESQDNSGHENVLHPRICSDETSYTTVSKIHPISSTPAAEEAALEVLLDDVTNAVNLRDDMTTAVPNNAIIPERPYETYSDWCDWCKKNNQCTYENDIKESLKQWINSYLGFTIVPNITNPIPPNAHLFIKAKEDYTELKHKIEKLNEEAEDIDEALLGKHLFIAATTPPFLLNSSSTASKNSFYFHFKEEDKSMKVKNARLRVYIHACNATSRDRPLLRAMVYTANGTQLALFKIKRLRKLFRRVGYWCKIRVTGIVRGWFANFIENSGIKFEMLQSKHINLVETGRSSEQRYHTPYLDITLVDRRHRQKRQVSRGCDPKDTNCCPIDFYVDFESLGWNHIISPTGFNMKYCFGTCTKPQYRGALQYNDPEVARQRLIRSCCAPKRVSQVALMYYDNAISIVHDHVPMKIETCECQ